MKSTLQQINSGRLFETATIKCPTDPPRYYVWHLICLPIDSVAAFIWAFLIFFSIQIICLFWPALPQFYLNSFFLKIFLASGMSGCSYLNNRLKALRYCPDPSTFSDSENVWFDIFLKLSSGPINNFILLTAVFSGTAPPKSSGLCISTLLDPIWSNLYFAGKLRWRRIHWHYYLHPINNFINFIKFLLDRCKLCRF